MSALRLSAELSPERLVLFKQHRGPIKNKHACWVWRGHTCKKSGYGVFSIGRRNVRAHRMAYALAHGETPAGILVCHTCDNRPCVNPRHLFLGDHLLNARDMVAKGRQARGRGERHHSAKLTAIEVSEIRKRYAAGGISTPKLGREYGVSHQVIHRIIGRKIWKNVP